MFDRDPAGLSLLIDWLQDGHVYRVIPTADASRARRLLSIRDVALAVVGYRPADTSAADGFIAGAEAVGQQVLLVVADAGAEAAAVARWPR